MGSVLAKESSLSALEVASSRSKLPLQTLNHSSSFASLYSHASLALSSAKGRQR